MPPIQHKVKETRNEGSCNKTTRLPNSSHSLAISHNGTSGLHQTIKQTVAHLSEGSDLLVQSESLDVTVSRYEEHHQQLLTHQQWVALQIVCEICLGGREGGREGGEEERGKREPAGPLLVFPSYTS